MRYSLPPRNQTLVIPELVQRSCRGASNCFSRMRPRSVPLARPRLSFARRWRAQPTALVLRPSSPREDSGAGRAHLGCGFEKNRSASRQLRLAPHSGELPTSGFLAARIPHSQNVLLSLANWDHGESLEQLVRLVRLTRPEVILTFLPRNIHRRRPRGPSSLRRAGDRGIRSGRRPGAFQNRLPAPPSASNRS